MGTNYYALKHPNISEKEALHKLIDEDNFNDIEDKVLTLYGKIHINYETMSLSGGKIHLGKRSVGWKFLWNPNIFTYKDYRNNKLIGLSIYSLNKQGILSFISQDNIIIVDEYDEIQDKKEFWNMALNWGQPNDWDSDSYQEWELQNNGKRINHIFKSNLITYLKDSGYQLSKINNDFYSDGLRFATSIDFS